MYTRFRNLAHILQDKQGIFTAYYITIHYLSTYLLCVRVCMYVSIMYVDIWYLCMLKFVKKLNPYRHRRLLDMLKQQGQLNSVKIDPLQSMIFLDIQGVRGQKLIL